MYGYIILYSILLIMSNFSQWRLDFIFCPQYLTSDKKEAFACILFKYCFYTLICVELYMFLSVTGNAWGTALYLQGLYVSAVLWFIFSFFCVFVSQILSLTIYFIYFIVLDSIWFRTNMHVCTFVCDMCILTIVWLYTYIILTLWLYTYYCMYIHREWKKPSRSWNAHNFVKC